MKTKGLRRMVPVAWNQVRIAGGFWGPRLRVNREATLPIEYEQCRKTGRIDAWKLAWKPGQPNPPHIFWDSDVAKWLEAVAYSLATHPDPRLERKADAVIDLIVRAQRRDGYINTHFTAVEPQKRWTNLRDCHELYCAGHLIEAAVAYFRATGKRQLLETLCRYADHIASVFGTAPGQKRGYCGHPEIELALVKLHRATGNPRYLQLARFFIDERGRKPHYFDVEARARGDNSKPGYDVYQAHLPVRRQTTATGHAVRACYLYAGMADVAAETGDRELLGTCQKIWNNITTRRMYIHGGIGSSRFAERFTFDYDLPNEGAYAETCANIALVFFAHRMLQIHPDRRYADVIERALYNGIISGVALDGKRFFYANYLASFPGAQRFSGQLSPERQAWFGCACCPPNLARLLAALGEYIYSRDDRRIYVHLYIAGRARIKLADQMVELEQKTDYPWRGAIRIRVRPERPGMFALCLRLPGWCRKADLKLNGQRIHPGRIPENGYIKLERRWQADDTVELRLAMPPERIEANPRVRQDCGRVALQRGPLVYCLEEADNGSDLNDIALSRNARLAVRFDRRILGGVPAIAATGRRRVRTGWPDRLYRPAGSRTQPAPIKAIPYFMWANRDAGEMLVWIRED